MAGLPWESPVRRRRRARWAQEAEAGVRGAGGRRRGAGPCRRGRKALQAASRAWAEARGWVEGPRVSSSSWAPGTLEALSRSYENGNWGWAVGKLRPTWADSGVAQMGALGPACPVPVPALPVPGCQAS